MPRLAVVLVLIALCVAAGPALSTRSTIWEASHQSIVSGIVASPNNDVLASFSWDGTIAVRSIHDGKLLWTARREGIDPKRPDGLQCAEFIGDRYVAIGGEQGVLTILSAKDGTVVRTHRDNEENAGVDSLCLSPDGKLLAAGASDFFVNIYDVETGSKIFSKDLGFPIHSLLWIERRDATRMLVAGGHGAKIMQITPSKEYQTSVVPIKATKSRPKLVASIAQLYENLLLLDLRTPVWQVVTTLNLDTGELKTIFETSTHMKPIRELCVIGNGAIAMTDGKKIWITYVNASGEKDPEREDIVKCEGLDRIAKVMEAGAVQRLVFIPKNKSFAIAAGKHLVVLRP